MTPRFFAVAAFAVFTSFGQVQSGRIVGTVYDPNKAVVPGAAVTVTDVATNISRRVVTNETGDYVVTPLNPGIYTVSATANGFQTTIHNNVELLVGQDDRVDFELAVGSTNTQVEVTTTAAALNTESATLGQQISNEQLVDLPLNGRGFHELAQLTPGSVLLAATGNVQLVRPEYVNGEVIGGVAGLQTTFMVDGVDVTEQHQGGTWIEPSIDALQEFSVQEHPYSAEYKRAGGTFNAITKSGSNQYHGNAFEFLRNDYLDARSFFSLTRAILKRHQFGGTIGGPLSIPHLYNGKDKTFFFISYQGMRLRQGSPANSTVPSAAERNGDFSAPGLNAIYDPLTLAGTTRTPFPGKMIPANRLSPQMQFFLPYIPLPNTALGTAVYSPNSSLRREELITRVDRQINSANRLFVRWSYVDNREGDPAAFPALGTAILSGLADNIDVALTSTLRSNMVHEFRYNYLIGNYRSSAYFQGTNFNQLAGITGISSQDDRIATLPAFSFSGYAGFSGQAGDGRPKFQNRLVNEFTDNLTWIKGRHIVKFGVDLRYFKILFTDTRSHVGSWSFNGSWTQNPASSAGTGDAFADAMLGFPNSGTRSNPATWWGGYGWYKHFFIQDDIKVSHNLTINLGLRYENSPWLTAYRNVVSTFDPTQPKPIIVGSDDGSIDLAAQPIAAVGFQIFKDLITTSNTVGLSKVISQPDNHQFAPRVGLAWRPFGGNKTVVRAGYGIFYEPESTTVRLNFNFLPWNLTETVNATQNVIPTRTLADYYLGAQFGAADTTPSWLPAAVHMRMGYDQHFSVGIQQQIRQKLTAEVDYVGNRQRFGQGGDAFNDPAAGPGTVQTRRPYPRFGTMTWQAQDRSSEYDSLQAQLQQHLSSGMWFMVSYTWSRSFQWGQNPGIGGDFAWEKAPVSFDVPQNIAISYGAALPFGHGKRFLTGAHGVADAIIGGWQLTGSLIFRSGLAFTPGVSRDVANTGVGGQRPNRTCSGQLQNPTLAKWFDSSCFTVPANYTYGNSGAGILRSDYLGNVSASLSKQFRLAERARLDLRAEAFNLPNAAYFNGPATSIDSSTVGRVTSTSNSPRQMQLAVKVNF